MSDIPADDGPAPADGAGIDADAFSPVIDPDYVPAQRPLDDAGTKPAEPDQQRAEQGDDK